MKSLADQIIESGDIHRKLLESETVVVMRGYIEVLRQRDELLAALQRLVAAKDEKVAHGDTPLYRSLKTGAWEAAREAIAKAEGKE